MEKVETVIVGGGPAGLSCALNLARTGREVLLLEKKNSFCSKTCGEGITPKFHKLGIPLEKVIDRRFKKQIVYTPKYEIETSNPLVRIDLISREKLGKWMENEAKKFGADVRKESYVNSIKKNYIVVNKSQRIFYKYLVGADGTNSIVRRYVGLNLRDFVIALHYKIKANVGDISWYVGSKFGLGYGWVFPHSNFVSVGVCDLKSRINMQDLRARLDRFVKELGFDFTHAKFEAAPINIDYRGYKFGDVYLIGDAAGFTPPLTSEGMYPAIVSGREVARIIINPRHKQNEIEKLISFRNKQEKIINYLNKFSFMRDFIYNILAKLYRLPFVKKRLLEIISLKG